MKPDQDKSQAELIQDLESLRRQNAHFQAVLKACTDIMAIKDENSSYKWGNRAFLELVNKTEAEVVGKTDYDFFPKEQADIFRAGDKRVLETQKPLKQDERLMAASGENFWVSTIKSPVFDDNGHCTGILVTVRDISRRKRAEEALQRSESEKRLILNRISERVVYYDPDLRIKWVNKAAAEYMGLEPEKLQGRYCYAAWHQIEKPCQGCPILKVKEGKSFHEQEKVFSDGSHWLLRGYPVLDKQGNLESLLMIGFNITERKQAEQKRLELERREKVLRRLESLAVMAAGIAHDFNNMLMAILGNIEIALDEISRDSLAWRCLTESQKSGQRGAALTRQLLAYSGQNPFEGNAIDPSRFVQSCGERLQDAVSENIRVILRPEYDLPRIQADKAQLERVLIDLVLNAAESYPEESGGEIWLSTGTRYCDAAYLKQSAPELWIEYGEPLPEGWFVFFQVRDQGCGMDEKTRRRIFEPFFTTKFLGRGTSLPAVVGIIKQHNGFIHVTSRPGRGTTVALLFPPIVPEKEAARKTEGQTESARFQAAETVLVVDDDPQIRKLMGLILKKMGFSVVCAANSREATDRFQADPTGFALVILDLNIPGQSGLDIFKTLKAIHSAVPVILLSSYSREEVQKRYARDGFAGFLRKPFQLKELRELVRQVL